MNKATPWLVVAGIIVIGGAIYMLSQPKTSQDSTPNTNISPSSESVTPTPPASNPPVVSGAVKEFVVMGTADFKFNPSEIRVQEGDTVKIIFKNSGGFHDWVIDEFSARTKQIPTGQEETISFVANKKGTFEYYCSVGQHRQMGMKGNLIVE